MWFSIKPFFHINELIFDAALFKKRSAFLVSLHFLVYQSRKADKRTFDLHTGMHLV